MVSFYSIFASAEQFGFHRASPACNGLINHAGGLGDRAVRSRQCAESARYGGGDAASLVMRIDMCDL